MNYNKHSERMRLLLKIVFSTCLTLNFFNNAVGQRTVIPINDGWSFYFAYDVRKKPDIAKVDIPHSWNATDVHLGLHYYRGAGNYERSILVDDNHSGKRIFLRFEGVNSTAHVFIDRNFLGKHEGGYTAFCFEITDFITPGKEFLLTVQANNAYNLGVLPLSGDFNVSGGIHRPVSLIITDENCITPLDYASPGVYLRQLKVNNEKAEVEVRIKLSINGRSREKLRIRTLITDHLGKLVSEEQSEVSDVEIQQKININKPRLWNGKSDPYLYRVNVQLLDKEKIIDEVFQPLGLRYYHVDPDRGFFLNGEYLDLYGVCRHQDVAGKASALTELDHKRDMELISALGATTVRLTHYPHSEYFYKLCNEEGLVVWSEIPLVGPGGYQWAGYINNPALQAHAKQVMTEMIRQNYNHPSIFFWGLFNELKLDYDDPHEFVKELHELAKKEDPSRVTTLATFLDNEAFSNVSDVMAWNKYFGWYGGRPEEIGSWADDMHKRLPMKPIAISEYGAGASIKQHEDTLRAPQPSGKWHPEGWQAHYHEENWRALRRRPFIWGKYIWVLADFRSSVRNEGDTVGINDKGIVTRDRNTKKDAYYFYKANWNDEPMIYIADRRFVMRDDPKTTIKVYGNVGSCELIVNGKSLGKKQFDEIKMAKWENVILRKGKNHVQAVKGNRKKVLDDQCEFIVQ